MIQQMMVGVWALVVAVCGACGLTCPPMLTDARQDRDADTFRALWVTRWDYRSQADVKRVIEEAGTLGITDIMWQVRGQADAMYASDLEPWAEELFRDLPANATSPGFDPLALAVEQAHQRGIKLHAWVNVMPLWKGMAEPKSPKHLFHTKPQWRLRDAAGMVQALNEHYVIVNPLLPDVQDHIVAVCTDIVTRYAVDGIHLDYVRFVSDTMKDPASFPGDKESMAIFAKGVGREIETDKQGRPTSDSDKAAFRDFKRDSITRIVKRIHDEAVAKRPGAVLTAAVWRRPDTARETYLQDAANWLKDGLIDRAMPMIYDDNDEKFGIDLDAWLTMAKGAKMTPKKITPGIASYKHQPDQTPRQITQAAAAGASGVAVFSYPALFESVDPTQEKKADAVKLRAARLRALKEFFHAGNK